MLAYGFIGALKAKSIFVAISVYMEEIMGDVYEVHFIS